MEFTLTADNSFARVRVFVDSELARLAPDVLKQLRAVYERASAGDDEARAHALLSCRRILKSLADAVYPPSATPVMGADRVERQMTDDKYVNRLWQFVADHSSGERTRRLTQATVSEVGRRLDEVYDMSSKGVHADVSEAELDQCVLQTYLLIGDILRLRPEE